MLHSGFLPRAAWALAALAASTLPAAAALSYDDTLRLAREQAPSLAAQQHTLSAAQAVQPAATTLPDPRLSVGVENYPIGGPERFRLTAEGMTMQRLALMQDMPNRAKRDARGAAAQARVERERAMLAAAQLMVQREAALAWLGVHFAEQRLALLAELEAPNKLALDTLQARIAADRAMPVDLTMARQEAAALADRRDDALRDVAKARAALRRWVGVRADEPLQGPPPALTVQPEAVRAGLHQHAEIAPYGAMQSMAQAEIAMAEAEQRGDWSWELAYQRRGSQYGDMVSFMFSFELPWQRGLRQEPQTLARRKELQRIEAEREETMRRHGEELEMQLAELRALNAQVQRLQNTGQPLASERVALALAGYQAGRGDLAAVLMARRELIDTRMRLIELDAMRAALRVKLTTLIAE